MSIHELETRYRIGPLCFGQKLGRDVSHVKEGIPIEDSNHFDFSSSGLFAVIQDRDTLTPVQWTDSDGGYGYTQ